MGKPGLLPQPLGVCEVKASAPPELCAERHKVLDGQIAVLFAAMNRQNKTEGQIEELSKQVLSMDGKLDTIISGFSNKRKRTS